MQPAVGKQRAAEHPPLPSHRMEVESTPASRIWVDLDNSPHVPFFLPIIRELQRHGFEVMITARDCFQVCGLADLLGLEYRRIGRHYGKHRLLKLAGIAVRAVEMTPAVLRQRPTLAISHGSRSQLVTASLLGIPSAMIGDYEFAKLFAVISPKWLIVPEVILPSSFASFKGKVLSYPGIKEDVYAPSFHPEPGFKQKLGLNGEIVVTVRPPATEAHYHVAESDELFTEVVCHLSRLSDVKMIVLPRSKHQEQDIRKRYRALLESRKMIIPPSVVDGMNLIWHSDLVISGGGTMNREAAALGVPVYSTFRGKIGAVDHFLSSCGRLVLLESKDDVRTKIKLKRRREQGAETRSGSETLRCIVDHILSIAEETCPKQR